LFKKIFSIYIIMESNNEIKNNDEIQIVKKQFSKAMKEGQKRCNNKMKDGPEFQEKRRAYSKKHYDNNKQKVIAKVINNK
jgi:hypothetical protein